MLKTRYYFYLLIVVLISDTSSQSLREIKEIQSKYEREKNQLVIPNQEINQSEITNDLPREAQIVPYVFQENQIDSLEKKSKYFGYDFFTRRDTVAFLENLPPPADYFLGPGDELVISLWGETQLRKTYKINREGKIYDDKVGLMNLIGKTIDSGEQYLTKQFGRVYATLVGQNPSTFIDVSLGKLRSINVDFVGEVSYPGIYPIHPFSTVITGLIQAGGVDTTGSLRNIQVIRGGKLVSSFDLYSYLLKGTLPKNLQLKDKDIIIVPVRNSTITVDSLVFRPGIYEAKSGESIKDLIDYAGGLKPNSSSSIGIKRIIPFEKRKTNQSNTENYYINYNVSELTPVQNGDIITVRRIFFEIQEVEIIGQVKEPGKYYYYSNMKLIDLIKLSGGFEDTTFFKSIYHSQGEIVRRNADEQYEKVIKINLKKLVNGDESQNVKLNNLDRFVVHANRNFFEKENVQILGEVNVPGSYPLISDNETLSSLLIRAGDLTSKALKDGISIYRDKKYFVEINDKIKSEENLESQNLDNNQSQNPNEKFQELIISKVRVAWTDEKIILMPGDSVIVRQSTNTIKVSGEVYNPGLIEYNDGKSLRYYLNSAGGITNNGDKSAVVVVYANGFVKPKTWYSTPKLSDGATIIVNAKAYEEPFNLTQFATNWTSIISSMVTVAILSRQLSNSGGS